MELLKKLLDISGPSGNESDVRALIRKEIKDYVSERYVDKFGNLITRKKGKSPTVMLVAHMDEVGLMVRYIGGKGKVHLSEIGGIEPVTLLGEYAEIKTSKGTVGGVITTNAIADAEFFEKLPGMKDLFIDTGLSKDELGKQGVRVGNYVDIVLEPRVLGNPETLSGKAMDDRVGCYVLIELARRLKNTSADVYYVFTVQEEIGLYGAKTSVYNIDPDWAVVLDVTTTNEFTERKTRCLGAGPCISIKDADYITNKCINEWLEETAKKYKIPIQYEVTDKGSTDALSVSVSKGGIPTSLLSIPVRNIHTTSGIVHTKDILNAIKLLEMLLKDPPKKCLS